MKTVLQDFQCYVGGLIKVIEGKRQKMMPQPRLAVLENLSLSYLHEPTKIVQVRALLDTGNDITIVRRKKIWDLEKILNLQIYARREFAYYDLNNRESFQPAFPLALSLTATDRYSSKYGFISPSSSTFNFDGFDVWIGRDILNQLICTFNGVNGTLTVIQP